MKGQEGVCWVGGGGGCEFINNLESVFLLHDILITLRNSSQFFGYRNVLHLLFRLKIALKNVEVGGNKFM